MNKNYKVEITKQYCEMLSVGYGQLINYSRRRFGKNKGKRNYVRRISHLFLTWAFDESTIL
jgi:hypothetical protein